MLGNDYGLIIKIHWNDKRRSIYEDLKEKNMDLDVHIFGKEADLLELIKIAEMIVIKTSMVGLEAIALRKPITMLEFVKSFDLSFYTDYGFTKVTSTQELIDEIKKTETVATKKNLKENEIYL